MTKIERSRAEPDHRTRVGKERRTGTEMRILAAALKVFADLDPNAPQIEDLVRAAGISHGTFYNHFDNIDAIFAATSEWTTREVIEGIETALAGLEGPALRLGVGLRLFFAEAQADPIWCRFVARVWKLGAVDAPTSDLEAGLRLGTFRAPSAAAARDLVFGAVREALHRIGDKQAPRGHGAEVTMLCLQALGADPSQIAAVCGASRRGSRSGSAYREREGAK